jgi:RHS repeat-associated protein
MGTSFPTNPLLELVTNGNQQRQQAGSTIYHYDAENQRIGVNQTSYVVNSQPVLSQVLVKTEADGTQTFYVYGLGLIGQETGGEYTSYHFDFRGSTVALTDETAQVTERFQYSPYGLLLSGDTSKTPFLFNGMYGVMTDSNGLYYMRARFYSPEIRRFVNQDILLGEITDGQTLNRYAYVTGQPINYIDPFGLAQCALIDFHNSDEFLACLFEETFGWIFDLEIFQPGVNPYSDLHVNRNQNNRCPQFGPTESERRYIWPFGNAFIDCEGNTWKYDIIGALYYHGLRQEGNMSYRRTDPNNSNQGFQCVYDPMGNRVTTVPFMGSYDLYAPSMSSPIKIYLHRKYDVNPHDVNPNYPENPDLTEEYCTCSP